MFESSYHWNFNTGITTLSFHYEAVFFCIQNMYQAAYYFTIILLWQNLSKSFTYFKIPHFPVHFKSFLNSLRTKLNILKWNKWLIPFLNHSFLISYVFQLFNFTPRTFSRASSLLTFNFPYRMNVRSLITFTDLSRSFHSPFFPYTQNGKIQTNDRDRRHIEVLLKLIIKTFFFLHTHVVMSRCFSIICSACAWLQFFCACSILRAMKKKTEKVIKTVLMTKKGKIEKGFMSS